MSGSQECPAEKPTSRLEVCRVQERRRYLTSRSGATGPQFRIIEDFSSPLVHEYEMFMRRNDIDIAGIEFIVDADGTAFTYDINTNTNYNPAAEALAKRNGMVAIANHLQKHLEAQATPRTDLRVAG